jgi:hypothetical protein
MKISYCDFSIIEKFRLQDEFRQMIFPDFINKRKDVSNIPFSTSGFIIGFGWRWVRMLKVNVLFMLAVT